MRDDVEIEALAPHRALIGESPLWSEAEQALYWVDIKGPHILRYDVRARTLKSWEMAAEIGAIGFAPAGLFIVALRTGIMLFDPKTGRLRLLSDPEGERPLYRLNDAKVDARGRFWVGSVEDPGFSPDGRLYCFDPTASQPLSVRERAFSMPNALGWSGDSRTMYFADSFQRCIWAYDYDLDTGSIANRRVFVTVPEGEGFPDGLTVDAEDHVWNAQIDGWCVKRYDPTGAIDRVISLPVRRPTSVGFGGDNYETLFITTGSARLTEDEFAAQPLAGCVLKLAPGVRGRPEPMFVTKR